MVFIKRSCSKNQRGLTLTELAIVLGGMGLVMGTVWAIVSTVWNSYRFQKVNDDLMRVVQNVRDYYGPMGRIPVGGDITATLDANERRLIPIEMRLDPTVSGGAINHALASVAGGSFKVESLGTGQSFRVKLLGLSQSNCMRVLMEFPATIPGFGVTRVATHAGSIDINPNDPTSWSAALPIALPTAQGMCSIVNANTNEVYFDFKTIP